MSLVFKTPKSALNTTTGTLQNLNSGPKLISISENITEDGEYKIKTPDGYDAISSISVSIDAPNSCLDWSEIGWDAKTAYELINNEIELSKTFYDERRTSFENLKYMVFAPKIGKVNTCSHMFDSCTNLVAVPSFDTSDVTNFSYAFYNCLDIRHIPELNTSNATDMSYMFGVNKLQILPDVPLFDTSNVTNMEGMFYNGHYTRSSLRYIPLFDTSNVTNMAKMFRGRYFSSSVPAFNTTKVTNMSEMFYKTGGITTVPQFNTSNVTNMSNMFLESSITSVPLFDTSSVTTMSAMLQNCSNLVSVPAFNTSNVTDMSYMLGNCRSITSIPQFDTSKVTSVNAMLSGCTLLTTIPELDFSEVKGWNSNFYNPIYNCTALTDVGGFIGLGSQSGTYVLNIPSTNLTYQSAMNIINKLGTYNGTGTASITFAANVYSQLSQSDIAVATGKNWQILSA